MGANKYHKMDQRVVCYPGSVVSIDKEIADSFCSSSAFSRSKESVAHFNLWLNFEKTQEK